MSTSIKINGVNLVPVKDATSLVPYSKDYIGRLAREGKIVASQIGRQWFIDTVSLKNFFESASLQEEARKVALKAERKRELQAQENFATLVNSTEHLSRHHKAEAVTVALATLCLGLIVGVSVYTAAVPFNFSNPTKSTDSVASVASPVDFSPATKNSVPVTAVDEVPMQTTIFTSVTEYPVFETVSETRTLDGNDSGILLFAKAGELLDAQSVEALFSDPVKVNFTNDNSGTIYFEREAGSVAEFPFVTVPGVVSEVTDGPEVKDLDQ